MIVTKEILKSEVLEYSEENKHLFSEEAIQFFELAKQGKIHSSKFWRRKGEMVIEQTRKAFAENPEQGLRPVLVAILNTLPEHTPAEQMQAYTNSILQEWQQLQAALTE